MYEGPRGVARLLYEGQGLSARTEAGWFRGTVTGVEKGPDGVVPRGELPAPELRLVCESGDGRFLVEVMQSGRVRVVEEPMGPAHNVRELRAGLE